MKREQSNAKKDSYELFLERFNIDSEQFYDYGTTSLIVPSLEKVESNWKDIKRRISSKGETLHIRSYGRNGRNAELFLNMYKRLYPEIKVKIDSTNNAIPKKRLKDATGYSVNRELENYQISHIFGNTKNIFMFEALWNLMYIPKIYDPFTGHETQGKHPINFQEILRKKFMCNYKDIISDYNEIIDIKRPLIDDYFDEVRKFSDYSENRNRYEKFIIQVKSQFKKIE